MNDEAHKNQQDENAESPEWNTWIVASGKELMEAFGLTAENRPTIKLNPEHVPDEFKTLIPYAEAWGITDDLIRADVIRKASTEVRQDFVLTISKYQEAINEWLVDPNVYQYQPTQEYYTFSALLMAFDETKTDF